MTSSADILPDFEALSRRRLAEDGIANPSAALLRTRLMLDHAKAACILGHDWPGMLYLKTADLDALDAAASITTTAYRTVRSIELAVNDRATTRDQIRHAYDRLAESTSPVELVALLRRAQDERNEAIAETIRLESKLTIAEIAIATAQQENRAPTWPPACQAA